MARKIIVLGDPTDHGGKVISGSPSHTIGGKAIARKGDKVDCPQKYPDGSPHGVNEIIEGEAKMPIDGIPVALEGHKTVCGCSLIGTSNATYGGAGASSSGGVSQAQLAITPILMAKETGLPLEELEFFMEAEDKSGKPVQLSYRVNADGKKLHEGKLDSKGRTKSFPLESSAIPIFWTASA
jgi:uncharacterized Zn-binding protein involved in type VI secretion